MKGTRIRWKNVGRLLAALAALALVAGVLPGLLEPEPPPPLPPDVGLAPAADYAAKAPVRAPAVRKPDPGGRVSAPEPQRARRAIDRKRRAEPEVPTRDRRDPGSSGPNAASAPTPAPASPQPPPPAAPAPVAVPAPSPAPAPAPSPEPASPPPSSPSSSQTSSKPTQGPAPFGFEH